MAQLHTAFHAVNTGARHTVVDHIDDAADGAGAIQQGRGAPQYLNTVRQQGLDRHRVVGTHSRGIGTAGAILQHGHPRSLLPTNHGLADTGAKRCIGQPGHVTEGIANRRPRAAAQVIARQYGHRQGGFSFLLAQGCRHQHVFDWQRLRRRVCTGHSQRNRHETFHDLLLKKTMGFFNQK